MRSVLRRLDCLVVTLGFAALGTGGEARAQEPDPSVTPAFAKDAPYRILADQLTGSVEIRNSRGTLLDRWTPGGRERAAPLASIPPGRPVVVELLNANPLLYRYDVSAAVVARGGVKSCTGIGSRFASTGFLTSLVATGGSSPGMPLVDPGQVLPPPPELPPGTRGDVELTASFLTAAAIRLRPHVTAYLGQLERIRFMAGSFDDSLALAAELGESVPLDSLLERLQATLERNLPGLRSAAQVPLAVRRAADAARAPAAELPAYAAAIRRGEYAGGEEDPAAREILGLADTIQKSDAELPALARRLQGQVRRLELARQGTHQVFSLAASPDYRRIAIEVQPTPEFPEVLRIRAGRQELFTQPTASWLCQISVGVGFMDRTPAFAGENGVLVDRDASEERVAPTFLVHLASAKLPWVGALAGLGFGSHGRPDFYLGGSLRVLDPLLVNFGVVWQRGEQLPPGTRLGDPVTDPAMFNNLPRRYYRSFFWGLSVGR